MKDSLSKVCFGFVSMSNSSVSFADQRALSKQKEQVFFVKTLSTNLQNDGTKLFDDSEFNTEMNINF